MKHLITVVICLLSTACFAQIINPGDLAVLSQTKFIDVYSAPRDSKDCEDLKYVDIMDSTGISTCFHIYKKLSGENVKRILELLTAKHSFHKLQEGCFTTDMGMTFLDANRKIIWHAMFSLICNAASLNSSEQLQLGLTNSAKRKLIRITGFKLYN